MKEVTQDVPLDIIAEFLKPLVDFDSLPDGSYVGYCSEEDMETMIKAGATKEMFEKVEV